MAILTVPTDDALRDFVSAYALGPLGGARGIEAGTVNTSYALRLGERPYFLRIYEEQGASGAEAEAELLVHLAGARVPTPSPEPGRDGRRVRLLAGKPAALFPWVEGEMLCQRAVTPAAAFAVGAALARVHVAGPPPGSALGEGRFGPPELLARCARVAASPEADARAQAEPLRAGLLAFAARRRADLPRGLVHGDLFRDNVLWREGELVALLDFESAFIGPFAYDLAVLLLSWSFADDFVPAIARALVDGYREGRELEPSEREALHDEALFATMRFTTTRITDDAIRVGKRWQRFVARREALEALGPHGLREMLGL